MLGLTASSSLNYPAPALYRSLRSQKFLPILALPAAASRSMTTFQALIGCHPIHRRPAATAPVRAWPPARFLPLSAARVLAVLNGWLLWEASSL